MLLLTILDILLIVVGGVGMGYQALCILISLFAKPVVFPAAPMDKRYAVLISARNEEAGSSSRLSASNTKNAS